MSAFTEYAAAVELGTSLHRKTGAALLNLLANRLDQDATL